MTVKIITRNNFFLVCVIIIIYVHFNIYANFNLLFHNIDLAIIFLYHNFGFLSHSFDFLSHTFDFLRHKYDLVSMS